MKKFFLFKRRDVSATSSTTSDTGEGLDILAVSTDQLAFMTASLGKVNIVFNDATIYEDSNLLDGESFKKTTVSVACEQGGEAALIDSILNFISSDRVKTNVMRFDAIEGQTNVKEAKIESFTDVVSEVKQLPVVTSTQEVSKRTFIGGTAGTAFGTGNSVGGIDFGDGNKPVIDFNEDGLGESGGNVNAWTHSGTGGSSYNITGGNITGTIPLDTTTGRANNGLATQAADMGTSDTFELGATYTQSGAFTAYAVVGLSTSDIASNPKMGFLFQGSAASGQGLSFMFMNALSNRFFQFKFATEKGDFIKGESATPIVQVDKSEGTQRTAYVFVIRRDDFSNIAVYDNDGSVVAFIPANTEGNQQRTDFDLVFDHIGNGGYGEKFQGNVARLGIIAKDIGSSACSTLALDLAKKYTPSS